jgi:hypothetical protein
MSPESKDNATPVCAACRSCQPAADAAVHPVRVGAGDASWAGPKLLVLNEVMQNPARHGETKHSVSLKNQWYWRCSGRTKYFLALIQNFPLDIAGENPLLQILAFRELPDQPPAFRDAASYASVK